MALGWWQKTAAAVGLIGPLQQLQNAINNKHYDDTTQIMKLVTAPDTFYKDDISKAKQLMKTAFWIQKSNGYEFTPRCKLLSAVNLSIVIKKIGDENIEKQLFEYQNKQILSHYPQNDLLYLLEQFPSDNFAHFVFEQFKDWLNSPLFQRKQYLKMVSVDIMIMIYKYKDIGKHLPVEELIIFFEKIKNTTINKKAIKTTISTSINHPLQPLYIHLEKQQILSSVTQQLISKDLYYVLRSNLVTEHERNNIIDQVNVVKLNEFLIKLIQNNSWISISKHIASYAAKKIIIENVKILDTDLLRIVFMNKLVTIAEIKIVVYELMRRHKEIKKELKIIQDSINEYQQKLTQTLSPHHNDAIYDITDIQHDIEGPIQIANDVNNQLTNKWNESKRLRREINNLYEWIKKMHLEIHEQRDQEIKEIKQTLENTTKELKERIDIEEERENKMEEWNTRYNILKSANEKLKNECNKNENAVREMKGKYDKLEEENTILMQGKCEVNDKYLMVNQDKIALEKVNEELKIKKDNVEQKINDIEENAKVLSQQIDKLTTENNDLLQGRKNMEYTINELQKENEDFEESNDILRQEEMTQMIRSGDRQQSTSAVAAASGTSPKESISIITATTVSIRGYLAISSSMKSKSSDLCFNFFNKK